MTTATHTHQPPSLEGLTQNQLNVCGPGRRNYRFEREFFSRPEIRALKSDSVSLLPATPPPAEEETSPSPPVGTGSEDEAPVPPNVAMLVLLNQFARLQTDPAAREVFARVTAAVVSIPGGQRLLKLLELAAALETERNMAYADLRTEHQAHVQTRAALALKFAPPEESHAEFAASHDHLTMLYLRQWFKQLPADEQAVQPPLIKDLVKPWHKRGLAWEAVTFRANKVGLTPYEMSPPKAVAKGQGAIQPVDFTRPRRNTDPHPAA